MRVISMVLFVVLGIAIGVFWALHDSQSARIAKVEAAISRILDVDEQQTDSIGSITEILEQLVNE